MQSLISSPTIVPAFRYHRVSMKFSREKLGNSRNRKVDSLPSIITLMIKRYALSVDVSLRKSWNTKIHTSTLENMHFLDVFNIIISLITRVFSLLIECHCLARYQVDWAVNTDFAFEQIGNLPKHAQESTWLYLKRKHFVVCFFFYVQHDSHQKHTPVTCVITGIPAITHVVGRMLLMRIMLEIKVEINDEALTLRIQKGTLLRVL